VNMGLAFDHSRSLSVETLEAESRLQQLSGICKRANRSNSCDLHDI